MNKEIPCHTCISLAICRTKVLHQIKTYRGRGDNKNIFYFVCIRKVKEDCVVLNKYYRNILNNISNSTVDDREHRFQLRKEIFNVLKEGGI